MPLEESHIPNRQSPKRAVDTKEKTLLTGENLPFIEQLYAQYLEDPESVDSSWVPFFKEHFDAASRDGTAGPSFTPRGLFAPMVVGNGHAASDDQHEFQNFIDSTRVSTPQKSAGFAAKVETMLRAYRLHGHAVAAIDPLDSRNSNPQPELDPATYGFGPEDLDTPVRCEDLFNGEEVPLGRIIERLRELYCGSIAIEYQYIEDPQVRQWLRYEVERKNYAEINGPSGKKRILEGLLDADAFETFLKRKYQTAKRFSLTGGDALIPMLAALFDEVAAGGVREILIGMAHRGRLNVLHNLMRKPAANMFSEFEKTTTPEKYIGSSDVKYHMGYSSDYITPAGEEIHLSLAFNPSHLEFVSPVVIGRARAKQERLDTDRFRARKAVMPLVLHGDAAFAGQGVVAETFNIADLEAYDAGGTVHVVINNQIGFTTLPIDGRSTRYSTDIAKMLEVPILHVNGNDPEACVRAAKLAGRYRQRFGRDVIIDLVCYRYYGHNEGDEPRFTQPVMYGTIDKLEHVRESYSKQLVKEGVLSQEEVDKLWNDRLDEYAPIYEEIQAVPREKEVNSMGGVWSKFRGGKLEPENDPDTNVPLDKLKELGQKLSMIPEGFKAHRTIQRLFKQRQEMATGETPMDWGFGEALAFASLLEEGTNIRLTGQDSIRGTFSHRHAAIFNGVDGERFWPARHLAEKQGQLHVHNSSLSETAVLGFEYGFSLDSPDWLVMWEAQFGDFVNGAQVIIDQFINSGEDKWKRLSGLVMLLPHGYEGQGPEHSSARLERFLQLCAEDNMFVCNLTNPAQIFHVMRRQVLHQARKPLVIMTPKSLLRLREATSTLEDLSNGKFHHIYGETRDTVAPEGVKRVLLCSGKVYYDLLAKANADERNDTAILRVEQLYPLDHEGIKQEVGKYTDAKEIFWVQEEPKNMGPWSYMFPELFELFGDSHKLKYIGREASASPATGDPQAHQLEQDKLVGEAFA